MAPPLAGKPPFATDKPDSFYEDSAQPSTKPLRIRQQQDDPNKRSSAYDMYENYLKDAPEKREQAQDKSKLAASPPGSNRNSGIGNLLLNMDDSDSDDDDDDDRGRSASGPTKTAPPPPPQSLSQSPPAKAPSPKPIAAPRPGYAAPIAALNFSASPSPSQSPPQLSPGPPGMRMPMPPPAAAQMGGGGGGPHPNNPFEPPQQRNMNPFVQNPFEPPLAQHIRGGAPPSPGIGAGPPRLPFGRPMPPGSPAPSIHSSTPHPLLPPMTPIRPAFISPSKSPSPDEKSAEKSKEEEPSNGATASVKFRPSLPNSRKIMRGNTEETLLPSRGQKGDDFWRRFSIVAKDPQFSPRSESSWLKKTRSGSSQLSRWVWIIGILLILVILGGVGVGVYFTRNNPSHQQPKAIGGAAANSDVPVATAAVAAGGGGGAVGSGTKPTTVAGLAPGQRPTVDPASVKHVSPTNTVARRAVEWPAPTDGAAMKNISRSSGVDAHAVQVGVKRHLEKRRLSGVEVW
ncbi:hypothetical protein CPB83DRAFT_690915 [Crepidotus variabilis]|uniref:Uncharacterized protein n=1 Tax=Crepidotus variabilis TaxID=179855 RepID=A0A9P6E6G7_9AGAR|nr:hypothetical protein CPB83DRAFT_690915 [Crepidotus variabilis]